MWAGTGFHDVFGAVVSSEEYIEQFVEYEGVVGRIDIYETSPVEIKTTSNLSEDANLRRKRPGYIEQLGIYCSMVDVGTGKIVVYQRVAPPTSSAPLAVYTLRFPNLNAVREEVIRRRDLLQEAITSDNPANLPKCPWYNMQCDYSSVCDCKTATVPTSYEIADLVGEIMPDQKTAQQLLAKLVEQRPSETIRLNDIVFPRKTYFARLQRETVTDDEAVTSEEAEERLTSIDRQGFLRVLRSALEYGGMGEVQRIPVNLGELKDRVMLHQGVPTIVRTTGLRYVVERDRLPEFSSHYFLRLGFECALSGNPKGRLLLYYRNVPQEDAKLLVYDVSFRNLETLEVEVLRRIELLNKATSPDELPACPSWMARYCKYAPSCGCGS
jgi:hypothetical protein